MLVATCKVFNVPVVVAWPRRGKHRLETTTLKSVVLDKDATVDIVRGGIIDSAVGCVNYAISDNPTAN
jgi:hypothetical protein